MFGEGGEWGQGSNQIFNMALPTLFRMDGLMRRLSASLILRKGMLAERFLFEFYKEVYPFLKEKEREKAGVLWAAVVEAREPKRARGKVVFGTKHIDSIQEFDFWLRDAMLKRGLLMARVEAPELAVQSLR